MKYKAVIILFIITLAACKSKIEDNDFKVARVYDDYLTRSDIIGIVPKGTPAKDSIAIVTFFINNWIKQKVLLKKAESNLSSSEKSFDKQLEDYRNSLIIYNYERQLINQKIDTAIAEKEIVDYYQKNEKEFELKKTIVKLIYVKLLINSKQSKLIKKLYNSKREGDKEQLEGLCQKFAVNSMLDDEKWLYFDDIVKEIPLNTYDHDEYLKTHKNIELKDSVYQYFVAIKDYRTKESISPFNLERDNIRQIIINKRKIKYIDEMQVNLLKDALKNNDAEILTPNKSK